LPASIEARLLPMARPGNDFGKETPYPSMTAESGVNAVSCGFGESAEQPNFCVTL